MQHLITQFFHRPEALPVAQPTVSNKALKAATEHQHYKHNALFTST